MATRIYYRAGSSYSTLVLEINGMKLLSGAYEALLTPASMKEYITNSSRLEHGNRIVSNPTLSKKDARNITISLFIEGTGSTSALRKVSYIQRFNALITAITSGEFALQSDEIDSALGTTTNHTYYKLVYTNCSKYGDYGIEKGKFTLRLVENNPADRTKPTWITGS